MKEYDNHLLNHEKRQNDYYNIKRTKSMVYYILGIFEALLAFRLVFKVLGANPASPVVSFLYWATDILLFPFSGIFRTFSASGIETSSMFEPSVVIAGLVYAAIAWGIVRLVEIAFIKREGI